MFWNADIKTVSHHESTKVDPTVTYGTSAATGSSPSRSPLSDGDPDPVRTGDGAPGFWRSKTSTGWQTNVTQTPGWTGQKCQKGRGAGGGGIPHCVTGLLSKLFLSWPQLCYMPAKSITQKHWSNSPYLAATARTRTKKEGQMLQTQSTYRQRAVINCRPTYRRILFQTLSWVLSNYCQHRLAYKDYSPQSRCW